MSARRLSRRAILRGAGGVAIALPWLEAMAPRRAHADTTYPIRFVPFFTSCGTVPSAWVPGPDFALGPILEPLEAHKDRLLVLQGVHMLSSGGDRKGHNRGIGCLLTGREPLGGNDGESGYADGISLDQRLGQVVGEETAFRTLEFGVRVTFSLPRGRMSYTGSNQPVPPENNPYAMFDRIFGDFDPEDPAAIARRTQQLSILDAVQDDFVDLDGRLGAADRHKLDAHLTAIREIEHRLEMLGAVGGACEPDPVDADLGWNNDAGFEATGEVQLDLLAMALACDRTRIASIMWSSALSGLVHTWLGHTQGHHQLSHTGGAAADAQLTDINAWFAQRFTGLLDRLAALPEGDGSVLDHSVVMWASEQGRGQPHDLSDIPVVLAGSAGGYFDTGRHVALAGESHNNVLLSIAHALGVEDETFGDPAWCDGPLSTLT